MFSVIARSAARNGDPARSPKSPVNTGFPFTLPLICINAAHIDHRGTSITKKISSGILANAYDLVA